MLIMARAEHPERSIHLPKRVYGIREEVRHTHLVPPKIENERTADPSSIFFRRPLNPVLGECVVLHCAPELLSFIHL